MIQSMTAFARTQSQGDWGSLTCELRSINHRYLELSLRLPDSLNKLEMTVRERIRNVIKRGKVECFLRYQPSEVMGELVIHEELVQQLGDVNKVISTYLDNPAGVSPLEVLKWPGVLRVPEIDFDVIQAEVLLLLDKTLQDLIDARKREGEQLKQLFLQRLEKMSAELVKVRKRLPAILVAQREKLLSRFKEASLNLEADRLEQELVFVAQKIDVTEELERLDVHILEVKRCLEKHDAMGRRLDFLMQELNREANTLGSKSVDAETTLVSVELKVLIEQLREQVQNIE